MSPYRENSAPTEKIAAAPIVTPRRLGFSLLGLAYALFVLGCFCVGGIEAVACMLGISTVVALAVVGVELLVFK